MVQPQPCSGKTAPNSRRYQLWLGAALSHHPRKTKDEEHSQFMQETFKSSIVLDLALVQCEMHFGCS